MPTAAPTVAPGGAPQNFAPTLADPVPGLGIGGIAALGGALAAAAAKLLKDQDRDAKSDQPDSDGEGGTK